MDIGKIISMLMRMFGRRLINLAVSKGINFAASRGKPAASMTEAERTQAASGRAFADRAKKVSGATRRLF